MTQPDLFDDSPTPRYDAMLKAIVACEEWLDTIEAIADPAERLAIYQAIAADPTPERQACEIRLRANRKAKLY